MKCSENQYSPIPLAKQKMLPLYRVHLKTQVHLLKSQGTNLVFPIKPGSYQFIYKNRDPYDNKFNQV